MLRNGGSFVFAVKEDGTILGWGDNRNGERLQTIAYVINYGRGGRKTNRDGTRSRMGDNFMRDVDAEGERAAIQAMQAESDRLMAEIGAE